MASPLRPLRGGSTVMISGGSLLQVQGSGAGIGAEELGVLNAVAPGIVLGIFDGLGNHLHADDPSGGGGHGQGDGASTAIEVQHQVLLRNACHGNGGFVEPLGLGVVHLVEGPGGQAEFRPQRLS